MSNFDSKLRLSKAYSRIQQKFKDDECVILDGANATELQRQGAAGFHLSDAAHWGFDSLDLAPKSVQAVHKSYLDAGADIITTNTYSVLQAPGFVHNFAIKRLQPVHWMDMARTAVTLARGAVLDADRLDHASVAFGIGGDIETEEHLGTVELLLKVFEDTPPDLVMFETLSLVDENFTISAIEMLIDAGWPVWMSFRRCRYGVCGIHGQVWGGPEGDYFGRLANKLERCGIDALLINCQPTERVSGTIPWLRDFTNLPLGVYPNLGRHVDPNWVFDESVVPDDFAELALCWRAEGAQIIGGCCGVGPREIQAVSDRLQGVPTGNLKFDSSGKPRQERVLDNHANVEDLPAVAPWKDTTGRTVFPLPLPEIIVNPGVFVPTQGSYLIWKYLLNSGVGGNSRCLDVGCGAGILAVQLALNGATEVVAIDIEKEAVANTMTNAFRNGIVESVKGEVVDLYVFDPDEKFDLIVASLYQMPTDPKGEFSGHRAIDFWGRNLMDHFISNLPNFLKDDGTAYVMHLSLLGQHRTASFLEQAGYQCVVLDFTLYDFNPVFEENLQQIERVEQLSDAYHFKFHNDNAMVMYLLEIKKS